MHDEWTRISTRNEAEANYINSDSELPSVVLQTAIIPSQSAPSSSNLKFYWTKQAGVVPPIVVNFHFAEVTQLPNSSRREFNIYYNRRRMYSNTSYEYYFVQICFEDHKFAPQNKSFELPLRIR